MGKYLGAILSVIVGAAVVVGMVAFLNNSAHLLPSLQAASEGTQSTSEGSLNHVSITLQTYPNSPYEDPDFIAANVTGKTLNGVPYPPPGDNQDWVTYWPRTDLVVPAHSVVTITIQNYDGATPLLNPFYARAQCTLDDDSACMQGPVTVDGKPVTTVDPTNVSHTFTIHSIPYANNQPWLFVSVPVTAVPDDAKTDSGGLPLQPVVTQFSFVTGGPGQYIWQCFDPCGSGYNGFGGPMSTKGYMSGTFTVQ